MSDSLKADETEATDTPGQKTGIEPLPGHTSYETATYVDDYPYGRYRCRMFYWVESRKGFGDRLVTRSINPKNNRLNKPHPENYNTVLFMAKTTNGHIISMGGRITCHENAVKILTLFDQYIGLANLNEIQQYNIRSTWAPIFDYEANWESHELAPESHASFEAWRKEVLRHIQTCPMADILQLPVKPPFPKGG